MKSTHPLWTALYLPRLPLESFLRASPTAEPWAVAENRHILDCNAAAYAQGVRPGMARAAAAALAPHLRFHERDAAAERTALEGVAAWAGRYTPNVALANCTRSDGLLLEVCGSLNLFGGISAITEGLVKGVTDMGFTVCIASAPTAQGAWLLARGGSSSPCHSLDDLGRRLQPLPLEVLDCDARTQATLEAIGVRTVGEVLMLPRTGLIQRFGRGIADQLDRALGALADPRIFFQPPEQFYAALELPAEVREAAALIFALQRLVVQLGGFLAACKGGVQSLRIELFHRQARTDVEIGFVRPSRDVEHFVLLIREKFSSLSLKEPVRRLALAADDILTLEHENRDLLDDHHKHPGDWAILVERLRARLGNHSVSGIATDAGHRPEAAWRLTEPGESGSEIEFGTRPLWLLQNPKRLQEVGSAPHYNGPLSLLAGPERIESGWWDGRDAVRDYFVARAQTDSVLWIYRERGSEQGDWYLHGVFG